MRIDRVRPTIRHDFRPGSRILLLIHGLSMSREFFAGAMDHPALASWGLLLPDLPGFGQSSAPVDFDFTMTSQASLLWGLCDELGIGRVSLLGHSMGGTVAVCMSIQQPSRVEKVIVAEGNLAREGEAWSARIAAAGEEEYAAQWEQDVRAWDIPSMRRTTLHAVVESARSLQDTPDECDFRSFMASHRVPTFFIRGDQPVGEVKSLALCSELNIPVSVVPNAGHFLTRDNPDGFYRAIANLLV